MTIYIDPPTWPGHGRMWSHLVSDESYDELHAFARDLGIPERAFERDHYDIPSHRYADVVRAGAVEVGPKELLRRLTQAGLRRPKRRGNAGAAPGTYAGEAPGTHAGDAPGTHAGGAPAPAGRDRGHPQDRSRSS